MDTKLCVPRTAALQLAAFAAALLLLVRTLLRRRQRNSAERLALTRRLLQAVPTDRFGVAHRLVALGAPPDGVDFALTVTPPIMNFLGSLHGGAIATVVDEATTLALIAAGHFPGVSTSLDVQYTKGCAEGDVVRVEARVLRAGRTVAFTECRLYSTTKPNELLARGTHTKMISAPSWWPLVRALPLSVVARLLPRPAAAASSAPHAPPAVAPTTDRATGLPLTEAGKVTYFANHVGGAQRPLQGFDATCDGVLTADAANQAQSQTQKWELTVGKQVTNPMGALHGGCIATLVDIFGTAAIALSAPECGVASSLSVQYVSSAAMKSTVAWTAEIVKRGKRLVVVECTARDRKGRLVARGCVTKTLRGAAKL